MTYTPRPGMVCVSVSGLSAPRASVSAGPVAWLTLPRHPAQLLTLRRAWRCLCVCVRVRVRVLCLPRRCMQEVSCFQYAPPRDNKLHCSRSGAGRDSQFHRPRRVSICAQDGQPVLCRVDAQETAPVEEGATARRRALTWPRATVVLARQILSRHDGLTD